MLLFRHDITVPKNELKQKYFENNNNKDDLKNKEKNEDRLLTIVEQCLLPLYRSFSIVNIDQEEIFVHMSIGSIFAIWANQNYSIEKLEIWIEKEIMSSNGENANRDSNENVKLVFCHGLRFFLTNKFNVVKTFFEKKQVSDHGNSSSNDNNLLYMNSSRNYSDYFYFQQHQVSAEIDLGDERQIKSIFDNVLDKFSQKFTSKLLLSSLIEEL